jgi:translation initiation factor 2B subunit (eIF-2B alpha/beta/delta family)
MVKMALLRNPKADPKILNLLQDLKKGYSEKQTVKFTEEEEKQKIFEKQKVSLRKQLEKRSIEQGVSTKNQHDLETQLLFPEGTREKDYKKEKKHGLTEIEPINIDLEEDSEQILVQSFYRTYNKILKHLYIKYGNSGNYII